MEEKYNRNRIYIQPDEQEKIKHFRVLIGGAGIGSIIAECALRMGFEDITIVDGSKVEEGDLNCQNYQFTDIGSYKVECLAQRLASINPKANIRVINDFITNDNVGKMLEGQDVAINALGFRNDIPFVFDKICSERNITALHPYNFGWAGFLTVVDPDGKSLQSLSDKTLDFDLKVTEYVLGYQAFWMQPQEWLEKVVKQYQRENGTLPPPQLSVASWITAGLCTHALFNIATGKDVKKFPKFYLSSIFQQ